MAEEGAEESAEEGAEDCAEILPKAGSIRVFVRFLALRCPMLLHHAFAPWFRLEGLGPS